MGPEFRNGGWGVKNNTGLLIAYFIKPPIEKFGRSNGRTRDQLGVYTEKFYQDAMAAGRLKNFQAKCYFLVAI